MCEIVGDISCDSIVSGPATIQSFSYDLIKNVNPCFMEYAINEHLK